MNVLQVFGHQHIGHDDFQALRFQEANGVHGSPQRAGQLGDGVVNLGTVGINTDLNRLYAEIAQARRLRFANHHGIGLQLDAEGQGTGALEDLEEIFAQENLAAAQGQNKYTGLGHFLKQMLNLGGSHFAVIVVIEIAVNALLVAAISKIKLDAERNTQAQRPFAHLLQQRAHRVTGADELTWAIGSCESSKMPCFARSAASASASRIASSGCTSNSEQIRLSTI